MVKRFIIVIMAVVLAFGSAGCSGARETDEVLYVLALGVDKAGPDQLKITHQIAVPHGLAGGGEGKGDNGGESYILNTVIAPTLAESRSLLMSTMSRIPNYSHTKAIIVGEETARQGLAGFIGPLVRYREFRGNIYIIVVKGTAKEFMEANKPQLELLPSKFYESIFENSSESGYFLRSDIHDFYIRLKNNIGSPYAAYMGVASMTGANRPSEKKQPPEKAEEYTPGNVPRVSEKKQTEIIGTALFKGDRMISVLTSEETMMLSILKGSFERGFLSIDDPLQPKAAVNLQLRLAEKPQIGISENQSRIWVKVRLEGEISSIASGINYETEEYRGILEEQISQLITRQMLKMLQHTQQLGCDPVGFIAHLRPKFSTFDAMANADLIGLYSHAEIAVDVKTSVRRSGLMWRTSPILQK